MDKRLKTSGNVWRHGCIKIPNLVKPRITVIQVRGQMFVHICPVMLCSCILFLSSIYVVCAASRFDSAAKCECPSIISFKVVFCFPQCVCEGQPRRSRACDLDRSMGQSHDSARWSISLDLLYTKHATDAVNSLYRHCTFSSAPQQYCVTAPGQRNLSPSPLMVNVEAINHLISWLVNWEVFTEIQVNYIPANHISYYILNMS